MPSIYDNPAFFSAYAEMPRSQGGLTTAGEWHQLGPLFPDVAGKAVLDLGGLRLRLALRLCGRPLYWPVDNYFYPGLRQTVFLGQEVPKYHHTLTQILGGLLRAGFVLEAVEEAFPAPETLAVPGMRGRNAPADDAADARRQAGLRGAAHRAEFLLAKPGEI